MKDTIIIDRENNEYLRLAGHLVTTDLVRHHEVWCLLCPAKQKFAGSYLTVGAVVRRLNALGWQHQGNNNRRWYCPDCKANKLPRSV